MTKDCEKKMTKEERDRVHRMKKKKLQKLKKKDEKLFDRDSQLTDMSENSSTFINTESENDGGDNTNVTNNSSFYNDETESNIDYIYENEDSVLTG